MVALEAIVAELQTLTSDELQPSFDPGAWYDKRVGGLLR